MPNSKDCVPKTAPFYSIFCLLRYCTSIWELKNTISKILINVFKGRGNLCHHYLTLAVHVCEFPWAHIYQMKYIVMPLDAYIHF